ncbi:hypothetical protein MRX96_042204 [Rhipicephalus microplus]
MPNDEAKADAPATRDSVGSPGAERHAEAEPTAAYGDFLQFFRYRDHSISQSSSFGVQLADFHQNLRPDSGASTTLAHSSVTFGFGSSTPRQPPSVPRTPPSVPPDPGPSCTTGEVSSTPGSSSHRHTGPGSVSSASRASSRMSTELSDVPGTDDSDDVSANEPVNEQSILAASPVVNHHLLSARSRSSSSPSLSEWLEDTGADDPDDGKHDIPVDAPSMNIPPDHTMLLAEQVASCEPCSDQSRHQTPWRHLGRGLLLSENPHLRARFQIVHRRRDERRKVLAWRGRALSGYRLPSDGSFTRPLTPCCCYVVSTPDIYPTTITSSQGRNQPTASWSPSTAT